VIYACELADCSWW